MLIMLDLIDPGGKYRSEAISARPLKKKDNYPLFGPYFKFGTYRRRIPGTLHFRFDEFSQSSTRAGLAQLCTSHRRAPRHPLATTQRSVEALTSEPGYNRALNSPPGPTRHFGSIALSRVFHATICNHTINSLAQNVLADRIAVGYCVMKFDTSTEFDQVILIFKDPGRRLIVRTVQEAANALLKDWPSDDGEEFLSAVKACVDVMTGKASSWELRSAILRAANEAGVAAVAVLH